MRNPRLTDERGMALAVAIFALVVIGALVAGAFYASTLEQRTGRNSMYAAEAAQAAETGPHVGARPTGTVRPEQHGQRLDHLARHHLHDRAHRHEVHDERHPAQQPAVPAHEPGEPRRPVRQRARAEQRGHHGAPELRLRHGQGRGHGHQAGQVQRQRVQRDRERLAAEGLGQGQPGQRGPELHQGRGPGRRPERHDDRRGQAPTRTTSSARRRRWPTIRPSPATSSTSSAT